MVNQRHHVRSVLTNAIDLELGTCGVVDDILFLVVKTKPLSPFMDLLCPPLLLRHIWPANGIFPLPAATRRIAVRAIACSHTYSKMVVLVVSSSVGGRVQDGTASYIKLIATGNLNSSCTRHNSLFNILLVAWGEIQCIFP